MSSNYWVNTSVYANNNRYWLSILEEYLSISNFKCLRTMFHPREMTSSRKIPWKCPVYVPWQMSNAFVIASSQGSICMRRPPALTTRMLSLLLFEPFPPVPLIPLMYCYCFIWNLFSWDFKSYHSTILTLDGWI